MPSLANPLQDCYKIFRDCVALCLINCKNLARFPKKAPSYGDLKWWWSLLPQFSTHSSILTGFSTLWGDRINRSR